MAAETGKQASTPTPGTPESAYLRAIENLRAVVRQGITAFAAVAAVLVGTSPLTNLGKLEPFEVRWLVAIGAAIVALSAVLLVIARAASILAPREFRLNAVTEPVARAIAETGMLSSVDVDDVATLSERWEALQRTYPEAVRAAEALPIAERSTAGRRVVETKRDIDRLAPTVVRVRDYALWYQVLDAWRRARVQLFSAAFVAGVAIVVYAWAANPPDPGAGAGSAGTPRPVAVTVIVEPDAQDGFGRLLGAGCAEGFDAVALARTDQTYDLVVTDDACTGLSRTTVTHGTDVLVEARQEVAVGTGGDTTDPDATDPDATNPDATDPGTTGTGRSDVELAGREVYLFEGESWRSTAGDDTSLYLCGSIDTAGTTDTIVSLAVGDRHTVVAEEGELTVNCSGGVTDPGQDVGVSLGPDPRS